MVVLVALLLSSCDDSGNCPCSPHRIDPPLSDLLVTWDRGFIEADVMPLPPPDPIRVQAWLILENRNLQEEYSLVEVPSADVILVRADSTLGTLPLHTAWDGLLAPGKKDTILFFKDVGSVAIFDPACDESVLIDFMIRNADGETKVFRPDPLQFTCWSIQGR
jgi:hypothetical protein